MVLSMTAFASREHPFPGGGYLRWDIKSVNHRYFEPSFKLPDPFQDLEYALRDILRQKIQRGKINCTLSFEKQTEETQPLEVDFRLVDQILLANQQISERLGLPVAKMVSSEILKWPAVIKPGENQKTSTHYKPDIERLFRDAVSGLLKERAREGNELKQFIEQRLQKVEGILERLRMTLPIIQDTYRKRLLDRLAELNSQPDPLRLEQEMVFLAQKMDVAEEIDRLAVHVKAAQSFLHTEGSVGRRLDFLMQEFNREANTLASKSMDVIFTQETVELKVLIEQMREQIQNLE